MDCGSAGPLDPRPVAGDVTGKSPVISCLLQAMADLRLYILELAGSTRSAFSREAAFGSKNHLNEEILYYKITSILALVPQEIGFPAAAGRHPPPPTISLFLHSHLLFS